MKTLKNAEGTWKAYITYAPLAKLYFVKIVEILNTGKERIWRNRDFKSFEKAEKWANKKLERR